MRNFCAVFFFAALGFAACATSPKPVAQIAPTGDEVTLQFSRDSRSAMSELPAERALESRKELQKRKDFTLETMSSVAELGFLGGKLEEAAEEARAVIKKDFKNAEAMKTLIKVYVFSKQPREALLLADNALQVQPRSPDIIGLKGLAYYFLNDFFSARDLWKKALEIHPGHVPSQMNLAALYFQNQNMAQAGAGFERVLAVQPQNVDAQIGKALVLDLQGQSEQARELLQKVARENPTASLVQFNLAVMERDRFENYEKALEHMENCLKSSPKERSSMERALAAREELRALVAKKKMGKLSDEELRQLAKKSAQARDADDVKTHPTKTPEVVPSVTSPSASSQASQASPERPSVKQKAPVDETDNLEDALR
jgi:tetratricopeptide (TPR) repeat protein